MTARELSRQVLRARIAALLRRVTPQRGGVIHFSPAAETAEQAAQRAIASGRIPPFIAIPTAPDAETWQSEAVAHQQELAALAARVLTDNEPPS